MFDFFFYDKNILFLFSNPNNHIIKWKQYLKNAVLSYPVLLKEISIFIRWTFLLQQWEDENKNCINFLKWVTKIETEFKIGKKLVLHLVSFKQIKKLQFMKTNLFVGEKKVIPLSRFFVRLLELLWVELDVTDNKASGRLFCPPLDKRNDEAAKK